MTHTLTTTRYVGAPGGQPRPLGRHVEHDSRSRAFAVAASSSAGLKTVQHASHIDVLDQGQLGSCTGNALVAALGCDPFYGAVPSALALDEDLAVKLYSAATGLDSVPGTYPPEDTGSTGLAIAKAAKAAGLIAGYKHAFSLAACLTALEEAPVIVGVPWYEGMFNPAANGLVRIAGRVAGGHEFCLTGIDAERGYVRAVNSWGTGWGDQGTFLLEFGTLGRLLAEQGDATVLVPCTAPAPQPQPDPAPQPEPDPEPTPAPPGPVNPQPADPAKANAELVAAFAKWRAAVGA